MSKNNPGEMMKK